MLVGGRARQFVGWPVQDDADGYVAVREVSCTDEAAAPVSTVSGDHDDGTLPHVPDVPREDPPSVLHQLEEVESDVLERDAVDLAHLGCGHRWHVVPCRGSKRLSDHIVTTSPTDKYARGCSIRVAGEHPVGRVEPAAHLK